MRYGIIADIHSNLEALESVIAALSKERIDRYICCGDIVGYGADPDECVHLVKGLDAVCVMGNHDSACSDGNDISRFTRNAAEGIMWTRENITRDSVDFLKKLPLVESVSPIFGIVHGTLKAPADFEYLISESMADDTFSLMKESVLFIGHTHVAGIFEKYRDRVVYRTSSEASLSKVKKYIINPGSVGQPRDGDNRAAFAVFDSDVSHIRIGRVGYDIRSAQQKIIRAGLPDKSAERLKGGI
jgi:predicted phosphodiesterase